MLSSSTNTIILIDHQFVRLNRFTVSPTRYVLNTIATRYIGTNHYQIGLDELKQRALVELKRKINPKTVLDEVFSQFASW